MLMNFWRFAGLYVRRCLACRRVGRLEGRLEDVEGAVRQQGPDDLGEDHVARAWKKPE